MPADRFPPPLDAQQILQALDEHHVDYVLIGGLAVQTHGHTRMTNDVDLVPEPEPANLGRLAKALADLDAQVLNPGHEGQPLTTTMIPRATIWQLATPHGDVDVMHEVPGGVSYDKLRERALVIELGALRIQVASRGDLIRMKLARGRPIDHEDVAVLTQADAEG